MLQLSAAQCKSLRLLYSAKAACAGDKLLFIHIFYFSCKKVRIYADFLYCGFNNADAVKRKVVFYSS